MADKPMPLCQALHILATVHTKDDDVTGFIVVMGAMPNDVWYGHTHGDYVRAWAAVRAACGMQTDIADSDTIPVRRATE